MNLSPFVRHGVSASTKNRYSPVMDDEQELPRVLVVDDEEAVRTFVERVLSDAGYEVVVAADGSETLRLVEQQRRFDLFVLDVRCRR